MADESYGFENARTRLEEIVTQVRKKEVSLEKSLDLLEEGVRLANQCVEQIDHADWDAVAGTSELHADDQADAVASVEAESEAVVQEAAGVDAAKTEEAEGPES